MRRNFEQQEPPIKRKRTASDDDDERIQPPSKKPQLQVVSEPPTPSPSPHEPPSPQPTADEELHNPSATLKPKSLKRDLESLESERESWGSSSSSYIAKWVDEHSRSPPDQENVIEAGSAPLSGTPYSAPASMVDSQAVNSRVFYNEPLQAVDDGASQAPVEAPTAPASVSAQSERLDASTPLFFSILSLRGIKIDYFGDDKPAEIKDLVQRWVLKKRCGSPELTDKEKTKTKAVVRNLWHKGEPKLSDLFNLAIFDPLFNTTGIADGRDALWSTKPVTELPRSTCSSYPLPTPKPDHHWGFPATNEIDHGWEPWEVEILNHIRTRAYTQPTPDNVFPSFIIEVKSEARKSPLYGSEGQLAVSSAHRVLSWHKVLDMVNPLRKPSCTDAIVFGSVQSQRMSVQYVTYWMPDTDEYVMSRVTSFQFQEERDYQPFRDYNKSVSEWLAGVQKQAVKKLLKDLQPTYKGWKKGRATSVASEERSVKQRRSPSTPATGK